MFSERVQTQKLAHRRGQASFLSLVLSCRFYGGGQVNSHGSDFKKLNLAIHLFSFATEGRGGDLEGSLRGGDKGVQEMKCGQRRGFGEPLCESGTLEQKLKLSCESVLVIVLPLYALLCSSPGPTDCEGGRQRKTSHQRVLNKLKALTKRGA